jgi:ATP-dependent helicase HepA
MDSPLPGQRWVSNTEAELGLGVVLRLDNARLDVFFPAAGEHRTYSRNTAPLRRVMFKEGDSIKTHDGEQHTVVTVVEKEGLITYQCTDRAVAEAELADTLSFNKPGDRLFAGQIDDQSVFELRVEALQRRAEIQQSPVRGFTGGRVDLLAHQMYIASEVSSRLIPRVLLADEVGLGKTIEAGLIMHRLHLTGRAGRILVLVPEPLIHQWFVELLRRFNMMFSLYDDERCEAIEDEDNTNPFLESQLILCSISFLSNSEKRAQQAVDAGWDLLIVDEAHHLQWTPEAASRPYQVVESIAAKTPGLLLLTATPQQLGPEGHFARLRLLDPLRYAKLETFLEEASHFEEVAKALDSLLSDKALTKAQQTMLFKKSPRIKGHYAALKKGDTEARDALVGELLDQFGTGRVMFRNTRAALTGFPQRIAHLVPLKGADEIETKVKWLAQLLRDLGETEKVLTICRTKQLALDVKERIMRELNVSTGVFHEGMLLMQRDRAAAHFADEEGARLLVCSEIGSEGRNFQFAHHLVLLDLPDEPELLEQRIGRLDRIGQASTIHIHVPYVEKTAGDVMAQWYHTGLGAIEENVHGATEIHLAVKDQLVALREKFDAKKLKACIKETLSHRTLVTKRLERGNDRLLELNSCKPEKAQAIIDQVRELDDETTFEEFYIRLLDHCGMHIEELGQHSYFLRPDNLKNDAFPGMSAEGSSVTFTRSRALSREDMALLTQDHPFVRGALDSLLGSEEGNATAAFWKGSGGESVLLEQHYVIECVAPAALHVERFLPPQPVRIVVDHAGTDMSNHEGYLSANLRKGDVSKLLDKPVMRKKLFPTMVKKGEEHASTRMTTMIEAAKAKIEEQLSAEIERLDELAKINDHIRTDEVDALRQQKEQLLVAVAAARVRLDCIRLVLRMP